MKAFIEVDGGTDQRPKYNEETLEYIKTITVYKPYPYAYGFLLDTKSGDGDHLDCYVITSKHLVSGEIIDVEPIGMVEQIEDGEEDHKILVRLVDEEDVVVDVQAEQKIREFGEHYFDNRPEKKLEIGRFLGIGEAVNLIKKCWVEIEKINEVPQIIKDVGFDFNWDSKKVWALELPTEEVPIEELLWHFDIPFWDSEGTDAYNLKPWDVVASPEKEPSHFSAVEKADIDYPIDIMWNKGRWGILDGLHRLVKYYLQGVKLVKVRKVPEGVIPLILKDVL